MPHFRQRGVTGFFVCLQPAQGPWLLNFPTKSFARPREALYALEISVRDSVYTGEAVVIVMRSFPSTVELPWCPPRAAVEWAEKVEGPLYP
jgi:hypothetical protein